MNRSQQPKAKIGEWATENSNETGQHIRETAGLCLKFLSQIFGIQNQKTKSSINKRKT